MGVRLYPNTKNVASLEVLAGVPAGTAARLEEMEARHKKELAANPDNHYDLGYKHYCERHNDPHIGTYSDFLIFGWGKFRPIPETPGYAGSLSNVTAIEELFYINGIEADPMLCEGVHWC